MLVRSYKTATQFAVQTIMTLMSNLVRIMVVLRVLADDVGKRAATVASCLRGALPPVDFLAIFELQEERNSRVELLEGS